MRSGVERGAEQNVPKRDTQSCGQLFFGPVSLKWSYLNDDFLPKVNVSSFQILFIWQWHYLFIIIQYKSGYFPIGWVQSFYFVFGPIKLVDQRNEPRVKMNRQIFAPVPIGTIEQVNLLPIWPKSNFLSFLQLIIILFSC